MSEILTEQVNVYLDRLSNELLYSYKYIAKRLGVTRTMIYRYKSGQNKISQEKLFILHELSQEKGNESINELLEYFIEALKQKNEFAQIPKDKRTILMWKRDIYTFMEDFNGKNLEMDIHKFIDFALGPYCKEDIYSPRKLKDNKHKILQSYRRLGTPIDRSMNKMELAAKVTSAFLADYSKYSRVNKTVITRDNNLSHALEKIGGWTQMERLNKKELRDKLKFAYLEFLKNPPRHKKTVLKNGYEGEIELKDYK